MTTNGSTTRPLTAKQEAFANLLFQGLSQRQAYVQAGYSADQSIEALDVNACELAKDTKVLVRINELKQAARGKAIANVEERQRLLSEIAREQHSVPATAGHRITAMSELNKMDGSYAPEKHQVAQHVTFEVVYRDAPSLPQEPQSGLLPRPVDQLGSPDGAGPDSSESTPEPLSEEAHDDPIDPGKPGTE